ncbi:MAG: hypothetical protein KDE27_09200, partial [Planctomycetes bacterium]|nr:hypothetical protein [Planctomycetota bacterium]
MPHPVPRSVPLLAVLWFAACAVPLPSRPPLLAAPDRAFLEDLTVAVVEASRVRPGESAGGQGPNSTGCTLLRPGGRDDYPAFWIRDYAMSLDCGVIPLAEQLPLLRLAAACQPLGDTARVLASGSRVPRGAIPDHITFRGVPIYFPGTVADEAGQGGAVWGAIPPLDDAFWFVHMAHVAVTASGDPALLHETIEGATLLARLRAALAMPPRRPDGLVVHVEHDDRGVNFGFDDSIVHTGDLLFATLLLYRATRELAELLALAGEADEAARLGANADSMRPVIAATFALPDGMLRASTATSAEPDVWGTAFAVFVGALEPAAERAAGAALTRAYAAGTIAWRGAIRHVPTDRDARPDSAWESALTPKN